MAETSRPSASSPNELERLRDILYGEQARVTENRLTELESRAAALEKELSVLANEKVSRDTLGDLLIELGQRLKSA